MDAGYVECTGATIKCLNGIGMNIPRENSDNFSATFLNRAREYAPYFALSSSQQDNEISVVDVLSRELTKQGKSSFHSIVPRGRGKDPPDCEARNGNGKRIGIELTELVDGNSISATKNGVYIFQDALKPSEVTEIITTIIRKKDGADVKGGPYDEYILIIYCDDPRFLDYEILDAIRKEQFGPASLIDRVYFLESYCPWKKCCPYFELRLD